jgi:sec-independent protein translocase protein TatA
MGLSASHIILVVVVGLLLFGGARIAEIGKGLGEGIRQLKKGLREADDPVESASAETPRLRLAGTIPPRKRRRVVEIEVDDDEDVAEVARRVRESRERSV